MKYEKSKKTWTLNKMYESFNRFIVGFIIWLFILGLLISWFDSVTIIYIILGMAVLSVIPLILRVRWQFKHWICPHCGDNPANVLNNLRGCPDYCNHCGEKINGDVPIDIKKQNTI